MQCSAENLQFLQFKLQLWYFQQGVFLHSTSLPLLSIRSHIFGNQVNHYRITRYLHQPLSRLSYFFSPSVFVCSGNVHANKFWCAAHWYSLAINCGASIMQYLPFHYSLKSTKVLVKFAQYSLYSVSCRHLRFEMFQSTNRLLCFGHKISNRKYVDV